LCTRKYSVVPVVGFLFLLPALLDEDDDAFVYYPHPTKFQDLFSVETRWLAEMLRASVFLERFSKGQSVLDGHFRSVVIFDREPVSTVRT